MTLFLSPDQSDKHEEKIRYSIKKKWEKSFKVVSGEYPGCDDLEAFSCIGTFLPFQNHVLFVQSGIFFESVNK